MSPRNKGVWDTGGSEASVAGLGEGMRDEIETRKGKKGQIKRPHVNFVKYVIV